ncbi:MAG: anti-sigma F factor [Ruminococcaceae bacterium]|nr:anti-sigma F factor [Oscillospiraceae bacterium]
MKADNYINATIKGLPSNEALSRVIVASFASQADPTFEQIADIKTAVSEAVTNSIVHGYEGEEGEIRISCRMHRNILTVEIEDYGCGIENVEQARQPLFTTNSDGERTGMGFTVMELFMDKVEVYSKPNQGTKVIMIKRLMAHSEES